MTTAPNGGGEYIARDRVLERIQDRALWLSMNMVHHANNVRPSPDGTKVGGHQASSASVVTLMTSLYFDFMREGDRISVKPHAAPVYHAIQYLLGNLDKRYLRMMREFHGLQAYPSQTKDPDDVDFSTGSVGLGPVAPNFAALASKYATSHLFRNATAGRRYIAVVGDAELDEGSVWEAVAEPAMNGLPNILWVVDMNRQSLDRVIPGIRVRAWREMFDANGWKVIDAKYGKRLQAKFAEPNGELLRMAIDEMSNEVYQSLLRVPPRELREWLPTYTRYPRDMARLIGRWDDDDLQQSFRNLGGHDFETLREAFAATDLDAGPNIVFAYTLKGWRLPSIGDPQNHSRILNEREMAQLKRELEVPDGEEWERLNPSAPDGRLCIDTGRRLGVGRRPRFNPPETPIPPDFGQRYSGSMATQQAFGLILTALDRELPEVAERVATVSPDVASSTNLGGWINRVGVWNDAEKEPMPEESTIRALRWEGTRQRAAHPARHIRKQPVYDAGAARLVVRVRRRDAVPHRHAVRPVRAARVGRFRVQRLFGREVHRGGDAVGGVAFDRRRRSPVARHPVHRRGDTGDRLLRTLFRAGIGVDNAVGAGADPAAPPLDLSAPHDPSAWIRG